LSSLIPFNSCNNAHKTTGKSNDTKTLTQKTRQTENTQEKNYRQCSVVFSSLTDAMQSAAMPH